MIGVASVAVAFVARAVLSLVCARRRARQRAQRGRVDVVARLDVAAEHTVVALAFTVLATRGVLARCIAHDDGRSTWVDDSVNRRGCQAE
jgi:hypothetical protein